MSVQVRVPIEDAVAWDPWLTEELGKQAERLGLGYDGGEEEGAYEVFDFEGDVDKVVQAVHAALSTQKPQIIRGLRTEGNTLTLDGTPGRWLVPLTPQDTAYGKALHRVARELERDPALAEWLAGTGLRKVMFHEAHRPGSPAHFPDEPEDGELLLYHGTDLTIMDRTPTRSEAEEVARRNLLEVLEAVAEHVGKPLPEGADVVRVNVGHGVVEVEDAGDVDLEREDVRLGDGKRLTEREAQKIVRDVKGRERT